METPPKRKKKPAENAQTMEDLTKKSLQKLPPFNLEAEQAVLGAILLDNNALFKALEIFHPTDFYRASHQKIFEAMLTLNERGDVIDLLLLRDELERGSHLEQIGGAAYLMSLVDAVPTAANVEFHARIVHEKSLARRLLNSSIEIATRCYDDSEDATSILEAAEQKIFEISEGQIKQAFTPLSVIVQDGYQKIEELAEKKSLVTGVPTGFIELDRMTSGFQPSDLIILAARPAMGKTSFCLNIAQHIGVKEQIPTAVFSLEMSKEQLGIRLLCGESRLDSQRVRIGDLEADDWERLTHASEILSKAPIYIDDTPAISILEMRAKSKRLKMEKGLGVVMVDYLQLMQPRTPRENRQQEITEISRSLKQLAKELHVPVIALSQLSRAVEQRNDRKPQLSDLRECVTGDTEALLADGRAVPVRALVGQQPDVLSLAADGRIVTAKSDAVWSVGMRPVYQLRLRSGRVLQATAEHRVYTGTGWKRIHDLQADDRIAVARSLPVPACPQAWPELRIALLAHLIGDGSYLKHQPLRYTTGCEEHSRIVREAVEQEFGLAVRRYAGRGNWHQLVFSGNGNRWHPNGVNLWLRELGIFGQRSYEKRVPVEIFQLNNQQIALFLRHLWATDGTVFVPRAARTSPRIAFSTNGVGLAHDVASLLLRFGMFARIRATSQGQYRAMQSVDISGVEQQQHFLKTVGAFGAKTASVEELELAHHLQSIHANTNVDTLPLDVWKNVKLRMKEQGISYRKMAELRGTSYGGTSHFRFAPSRQTISKYADILEDQELKQFAQNHVFWDAVKSVTFSGETEVFDLTVPGTANWIEKTGIISHNSGAIEQDADIVMFIYRPEVYFDDAPEGIAEIIIGKQRNGPVGSVELAFIKQYTRFENLETHHHAQSQEGGNVF